MKKIYLLILLSTLSIFAKINVAVSIPPQEYILEQIAPNLVNTEVIVKPGNSPHTYEPKPSQMIALSKAKIYFAIGVEFENSWLPKFKAQNSKLEIVHTDKNITKLPITSGEEAGELDPHIWLSPKNLKVIATNMANALIKLDAIHTKEYKYNLKKFITKLDNLDRVLQDKLSKLKNRNFLIFHPSWGYFAKDYRLKQIAVEIKGKEPSAKELISVVKLAKKTGVKVIFTQPEFSQNSANLIAKELNIKVIKVSPLTKDVIKNINNFANVLIEE